MLDTVSDLLEKLLGLSLEAYDLEWQHMALRAVVVYLVVLAITRSGHKRLLGKGTAFDVVIGILLGSIASRAVTGNAAFFPTLVACAVLVWLHAIFAWGAYRSRIFARLCEGDSVDLIRDGRKISEALRRSKVTDQDLEEAFFTRGVDDLEKVRRARLERSGKISLIEAEKRDAHPTREGGKVPLRAPEPVISDRTECSSACGGGYNAVSPLHLSMTHLLRVALCASGFAALSAVASVAGADEQSPGSTAAPAYQLRLTDEYKLILREADAFKLPNSSAYRLQGQWARREVAPPAPPAALDVPPLPKPTLSRPFHAAVLTAAKESGVEPALIHAVIRAESGYQPQVVSAKGAVGLMQLIPETARRYGVRSSTNPLDNIRGGTRYLSDLLRMFGGNVTLALAAYNAGEGAVLRYGAVPRYAETRQYIPRVLAEYQRLRNTAIIATAPTR